MKQIIYYMFLAFVVVSCHMEVPGEITVDFSGVSDKGKVSFSNKSTGAQSFAWDFGDGSPISTEKEPVHTYKSSNKYSVKLIAKGEGGSVGKTNIIDVDIAIAAPLPVPAFTVSGDKCAAPCSVTFTNETKYATTYVWDFGNTKTSNAENPGTISYETAGTFHVKLTATGPGGTTTITKDVIIGTTPTVSTLEKVWENSYGTDKYEQVEAAVATSDGGAVLVGRVESGSGGTNEFRVVRINGNGDQVWANSYGGNNNDAATVALQVSDGFIIGGYSNSDPDKNKNANKYGAYDFWIVKVDNAGVKQWDKSYGGDKDDILKAIVGTSDGGFLLGGSSSSGANGNKSAGSYGDNDFWIVKVNSTWDKQWDKSYGGSDDDRINTMLANNRVITLAGYSKSSPNGSKTAAAYGGQDYWTVKINENGDKQGDYTFGGDKDDQIYTASANDRYSVGGESFSNGGTGNKDNKTAPLRGVSDFYVYRYDDTGAKTWDRSYGGDQYDKLHAMAGTPDGGLLLAGESKSGKTGNKTSDNYGESDTWLVKVDGQGDLKSDMSFGGSGKDKINCMVKLSDGTYLIAGESSSQISPNKTSKNYGFEDFWAIKIRVK